MSYKTPNVVKEIYLPAGADLGGVTLDEYESKYGIDLKKYVYLNDNGNIMLTFPENTKIYLSLSNKKAFMEDYGYPYFVLVDIPKVNIVDYWASGSKTAMTDLLVSNNNGDAAFGLRFEIDKDSEYSIENVRVVFTSDI